MIALIVGLVSALFGAVVGSWVTRVLGKADREKAIAEQQEFSAAQNRIAELEGERNKHEVFSRFSPHMEISDDSVNQ
jgi:uncharacterized membrane protein YdjX (TVP38/TMEM64 family)